MSSSDITFLSRTNLLAVFFAVGPLAAAPPPPATFPFHLLICLFLRPFVALKTSADTKPQSSLGHWVCQHTTHATCKLRLVNWREELRGCGARNRNPSIGHTRSNRTEVQTIEVLRDKVGRPLSMGILPNGCHGGCKQAF